jgi:DNA-binding MarR family transcriptional regulator
LAVAQALDKEATVVKISKNMIREPHTVSTLVERMVKKGLVEKVLDLKRKNSVRVVLTEKGKKAYALTTKRGPIHRILSSLTKQERKTFNDCLEKISVKARQELGMNHDVLPSSD